MPDWAQELLIRYSRPLAVLSLYPACYKIFAWVEDRLSASVKQEITAWLKSAGDFASQNTLYFNLLRFHNVLFGDKQLSMKCLARTTLFSLASFLLVFFPYIIQSLLYIPKLPIFVENIKLHDDVLTFIIELFVVSFILLVFPLDFFGVAVTRKLASLAGDNVSLKKVALISIFDTLIKTMIFPIMSIFFVLFVIMSIVMFNKDLTLNVVLIEMLNVDFGVYLAAVAPVYLTFFPSLLLCSAWVWLYFVGLRVVRVAVFLFDVDKQPVRSIGIVGAAVLTGCYGLYTLAVGGYTAAVLSDRGFIYAANQDYDRAIADYNEAIRLNPKAPAFYNRGRAGLSGIPCMA